MFGKFFLGLSWVGFLGLVEYFVGKLVFVCWFCVVFVECVFFCLVEFVFGVVLIVIGVCGRLVSKCGVV